MAGADRSAAHDDRSLAEQNSPLAPQDGQIADEQAPAPDESGDARDGRPSEELEATYRRFSGAAPLADPTRYLEEAARVAWEKKASTVVGLEVGRHLSIVDWFLVVSAPSKRRVETLYEEIEKRLSRLGLRPFGVEGAEDAEWVLLDYGDFVVHVMSAEAHEFYALEKLWADVPSRDYVTEFEASARSPSNN